VLLFEAAHPDPRRRPLARKLRQGCLLDPALSVVVAGQLVTLLECREPASVGRAILTAQSLELHPHVLPQGREPRRVGKLELELPQRFQIFRAIAFRSRGGSKRDRVRFPGSPVFQARQQRKERARSRGTRSDEGLEVFVRLLALLLRRLPGERANEGFARPGEAWVDRDGPLEELPIRLSVPLQRGQQIRKGRIPRIAPRKIGVLLSQIAAQRVGRREVPGNHECVGDEDAMCQELSRKSVSQ
jgi:hypothetical protein